MVMIYAGGHISGGHYNPAVTLAVLIRGKISTGDAVAYMISQVAAAVVAALVAKFIFHVSADGASACVIGYKAALGAELIGTFALAYVVLNVATAKGTSGNNYFGLAIGFTVLACGYAMGKYSGGAFNPAVAIGQSVAGFFCWNDIWVYAVGCFGGAAVAALVFKFVNGKD
jgi:aquaporin Z